MQYTSRAPELAPCRCAPGVDDGGEAVKTPDDVAKRVDADAKAGKNSILLLINRGGDMTYVGLRLN